MNDLQFSALVNNISVISGPWEGDNERLFAMEPPFTVEKLSVSSGS